MELSRRDALAALAAAGAGSVAGCEAPTAGGDAADEPRVRDDADDEPRDRDDALDEHELETLVAVGAAVYPSVVDGVPSFVRTYAGGRFDGASAAGVVDAVATLDDYTGGLYGAQYVDLDAAARVEALDVMSVDAVDPDPDGTDAQRVRHHLVNELLYALYASPTGASLAGLENPPGHPGGAESYREGPDR